MFRHTQSGEDFASSLRLKQVQEKLDECRATIMRSVAEMEVKFPKSIFDNIDSQREDLVTDINESEIHNETDEGSQMTHSMDDRFSSELTDGQTSIPEITPPSSPFPKSDGGTDLAGPKDSSDVGSQYSVSSPGEPNSKKGNIKHEMMKLFKVTTGIGRAGDQKSQASTTGKDATTDVISLVTSIPRNPIHSLLLLFRLELPKEFGIVTRLAVNADGCIAGCTVHGEVFVFNKIPYSRSPDAVTRGHDGGIVSILWLPGSELKSYFISNGTDKKTLLWQSVADGIDGPHHEILHSSVPTCCCAHPVNKDIVIMGFLDNTVSMYKVERLHHEDQVIRINNLNIGSTFTKPITAVSVSPDGKRLVVGSSVGTIGIYDLSTMSLDVEVDCRNRQGSTSHGRKVVGLSWSRDSTCVAVSSCDSRIRVVLISDLSRRTKFKSSHFINENLFLSAVFAPPEDERIVAMSESGNLCSWQLHTSSATNDKCLRCNLVTGTVVSMLDKEKTNPSSHEVVASVIVPATDPYCDSIQSKMFHLGEGFQKGSGILVIACDASGNIRIFAELFNPI